MEKIKQTIKDIKNRDVGATLYDRKHKTITKERFTISEQLENIIFYNKAIDKIDQSAFMRKVFKNESIHEGHEYNQPESVKKIPGFIKFYEIDMSDFKKEKPEEFETFNDFFTREVKPERRPIAEPDDDSVVVSPADCRLMVFESLKECTDLWIKGKQFSFEKLINGDKELLEWFKDGMVANFRLMPQDYHRFHTPVAGRVIKKVELPGECMSTQPEALQSEIDVLSMNERGIVVIQTEKYGKICHIPIGAEDVGRVTVFVEEGEELKKGQEMGYFSYGGSDIVVLFEHPIDWDEDLKEYTVQKIETLTKCNERIGKYRIVDKSE